MALCPDCRTVIPCNCHLTPPTQVRPGVYVTTEPNPVGTDAQRAAAAVNEGLDRLFRRLGPPTDRDDEK